ncbi:release factor H-coupled RctB family protein [Allochromatium warmingii]|uniref:3'-phosphate/5'-hydroxy nucleic acid ligase n=1 Tax=Allochromatium warmingii TaxID=61595 RepID=A0A1H3JQU3_ALLWA|nr:RNA ligase RtcB family protein [Allochromatium warmingii]SDY41654.1 release factor H-coupled RctB family protein [Allochromatium warmingii]
MTDANPIIPHLIASSTSWIEGEAVRQLEHTARLPGMRAAVGLPDLHPGKGYPIGAAFLSERIYPALVGNDIGCGMALWQTDLTARRFKPERAAERLSGLEGAWDGDLAAWRADWKLEPTAFDRALGTIGGGNHFAEIQQLEQVFDAPALAALGLDTEHLCLLVHSGSRGLGEAILRAQVDQWGHAGLDPHTAEADAYRLAHDHALRWAEANRALIAQRLLTALGAEAEQRLAVWHNGVESVAWYDERLWLHRKGAAPADRGPLVIPGSRGALSYLVAPMGDGAINLRSLAHGAGRKWKRGEARARLSGRQRPEDLALTALGGRVICEDKDLLYDEAPESYKGIERVISDLTEAGLCQVLATLRPVLTYKMRRSEQSHRTGRIHQRRMRQD